MNCIGTCMLNVKANLSIHFPKTNPKDYSFTFIVRLKLFHHCTLYIHISDKFSGRNEKGMSCFTDIQLAKK